MTLPARRGIYYLRERPAHRGGWYIFIRHRPSGELNKKKIGRPLAKYFDALDLPITKKTLIDKNLMDVVDMIRAELDGDGRAPAAKPTEISQAVGDYADWLTAQGRSLQHVHTTKLRMRAALGFGVRPRKSRLPWATVADISRKSFQLYLRERRAEASAGECNHEMRAWRPFCSWLVDNDLLEVNPRIGMKQFTAQAKQRRILSVDEMERFFAACKREQEIRRQGKRAFPVRGSPAWLFRAVFIDAHLGFRPAELARLTWESVDLKRRKITVRRKTKGIWTHDMSELLVAYLEQTKKKDRHGPLIPGFPYREDRETPGGYHETVKRAAIAAGLPDATMMTVRRSVATHLANAGESVLRLMAIMGWSTPAMAQVYVKLAALDTQGATDQLPWGARPATFGNKGADSKGRSA